MSTVDAHSPANDYRPFQEFRFAELLGVIRAREHSVR